MPECSLINEPEVGASVVKGEPGPQVRAVRRLRVANQELPAHAQMGEQRVFPDRQPQVLPAPPDGTDLAAGQRCREVIWTGQVPAGRTRMEDVDALEPAPADVPLQAGPDALHLWQLWHVLCSAFSLGPALPG